MRKISDWLYRISSWQTILLATLIYAAFMLWVMVPHAAEMAEFAGEWGAPDGHLFYTPDELYLQIGRWGEAGRDHYVSFRLTLDPLWALAYTAFLISITSVALRYSLGETDPRRQLNLVPLAPMLADLTENFLGMLLMSAFPERLNWLAWLAAGTSCFKWLSLALAHLIMLYALALAAIHFGQARRIAT